MGQKQIDILQRALNREKEARKQAEKILEKKSLELYNTTLELKKANLKLESLLDQKTSQLEGVFENIVDAYAVIDLQGNVLKMNDAAVELFGYNIHDEKLNVVDLIYKEDYNYAMESFDELGKKGTFRNYKARIYTRTKGIKWVNINASIIYDNNKQPIAAQGIIRDITEAMLNAQIIEEQKKQLSIIVENSYLGIVLTQFGKIVKANEAFQDFVGYKEDELIETSIKQITFEDDLEESQILIDQLDSGQLDNFVTEKRYKKKDGSTVWAKTNVNAVRNDKGNIKFQVAIVEDITAEREKKLIVETINEVAKAVLGKMDIYEIAWEITNNITEYLGSDDCVIYLVDKDNNALEQIAASGDKVRDKRKIANKIQIPFGEGIVGSVAKNGKAEIINNTSKDSRYIKDDKLRYSEISVPIISDGEVIGVIDSEHHDMNYYTESHLETLKNIAQLTSMQLKNAINRRERRKAEEQNKQLLKALERSNQELQDYAHIVSHDLKSPLRSISALISWLKEDYKDVIDEIGMQNFKHIENKVEKMDHLINGILSYSSINEKDVLTQKVDINEIINNIISIIFIPANVNVTIKNKLPIIKADPTRIQQLFQNLISNAVHYIDKPKGIVEIDYSENKDYYQFSVSDNGIGISEDYHKKIFEIFQSLSDDESTGIGLSIVKKIIDLYKGKIWIESELGKGTTFYFTLKKK